MQPCTTGPIADSPKNLANERTDRNMPYLADYRRYAGFNLGRFVSAVGAAPPAKLPRFPPSPLDYHA